MDKTRIPISAASSPLLKFGSFKCPTSTNRENKVACFQTSIWMSILHVQQFSSLALLTEPDDESLIFLLLVMAFKEYIRIQKYVNIFYTLNISTSGRRGQNHKGQFQLSCPPYLTYPSLYSHFKGNTQRLSGIPLRNVRYVICT